MNLKFSQRKPGIFGGFFAKEKEEYCFNFSDIIPAPPKRTMKNYKDSLVSKKKNSIFR